MCITKISEVLFMTNANAKCNSSFTAAGSECGFSCACFSFMRIIMGAAAAASIFVCLHSLRLAVEVISIIILISLIVILTQYNRIKPNSMCSLG